jgi:hypothetical protein
VSVDGRILQQLLEEVAGLVVARLEAGSPAPVEAESWRLLSVDQVAELFGRSSRWVHSAVKDRGLPYVRLDGGGKMFDPVDVRAWARARRVPAVDG